MLQDPCISLLRELVAIDSVNPSLVPGAAGEGAMAVAVAQQMRAIGMTVETEEVLPGRPNVVGVLEAPRPGRTLMFCGHTDTVGVDGMSAPFEPSIRDGRLHGRGSQDMKSGVAAMIDAVRLVSQRGFHAGRIVVAAVIDEEYASAGADALVRRWQADMAVVTEPTDLALGVAHKGFAWLEIETHGRAAHGSRPRDGKDAILAMGRVLQQLAELDRSLQARTPHPLLGTPSLHASIIAGGQELSSYPARCLLQMERRTVAGESGESAGLEVAAILDALSREDRTFQADLRVTFSRPAYEVAVDQPVVTKLADALAGLGQPAPRVGMSFWTDAAVLGDAGIPTVLFGPGGAGLHGRDEYVNVADVLVCRDALAALAGGLGG